MVRINPDEPRTVLLGHKGEFDITAVQQNANSVSLSITASALTKSCAGIACKSELRRII